MNIPDNLSRLRSELQKVREESLQATRAGDFMRVAKLNAATQRINKAIQDRETELHVENGTRPKE